MCASAERKLVIGLGADVSPFQSAGQTQGDSITDFNATAGERVDLRPITANVTVAGNHVFSWIEGGGLTGAARQLRFADKIPSGNVQDDGIAGVVITLSGFSSQTAANVSLWLSGLAGY